MRIELAHGNAWAEDAPLVRVETAASPDGSREAVHAAQRLAGALFHAVPTELPQIKSTYRSEDPTGSWDTALIGVEGEQAPFKSLASGAHWVAVRQHGNVVVSIEARHLEPGSVHLVAITDTSPYLADDGGPR